jgi:hypothetical protein
MKTYISRAVLGLIFGACIGLVVAKVFDYNAIKSIALCSGAVAIGGLTDLWMQSTS